MILLVLLVGFLIYSNSDSFSTLLGDDVSCDIVKDYSNACDDYTNCEYVEFEGNTVACINGEKIIYNIDSEIEIQTPQIVVGGSSK